MKTRITTLLVIAIAAIFALATVQPTLAGSDKSSKTKMEAKSKAEDAKKATMKTTEKAKQLTEKININTADLQTLTSLKGIGPEKAQNIIDYRSKSGSFKSIEDLKKVKGIGEKTYSLIAPLLTVK